MIPEKRALAVFWSHKRFLLVEALAWVGWAALALSWFWLPDSHVWGVAFAGVQGVVLIVVGLWLIAATLLFYRRAHEGKDVRLGRVWRESLRRVPMLLAWTLAVALAEWLLVRWKAPPWIWIVPAILTLPLVAQAPWRVRYFLDAAILAVAAAYLPYKLIGWHPQIHGLALQTTSLAVRFTAAYLLAVVGWLMLASLLGRLGMGPESDRSG